MAQGSSGKAERQFLLRSLTRVGPEKPVGYLPLYTLTEFAEADPDRFAADALARGLAVAQFGPAECCIKSGALYIYDRAALDRLLKSNVETLTAAGMPIDPDMFVAQIAAVWIEPDHPAYAIVAKAFGEHSEPH